jgi:hypothetical protein
MLMRLPWLLIAAALVMEAGWLMVGAASPRLTESDGFTTAMFAQLPPLWGWADVLRRASTPESITRGVFVGGLVVACLGFVMAIVVLARGRVRGAPRWIATGMVVFALTLLLTPGLLSTDLLMYAVYGRLAGVYGLNPYLTAPSSAGADALLGWASRTPEYATYATPYGPLWTALGATIGLSLPSQAPLTQALAYRLVGAVAFGLTAWLVWRLAPVGSSAPIGGGGATSRGLTLALYAWNPLVLFELIAGGHNDGLMLCLVMAGLAATASAPRRWWIATALMWAGALVKWVPALVLVFVTTAQLRTLGSWQQRAHRLAGIVGLVLVMTLVLFAPWLDARDPAALQASLSLGGQRYVNALVDLPTPWLASHLLDKSGADVAGSQATVRGWTFLVARIAVLAYVLFEIRLVWRSGQLRSALESSARTLLVGLLVAVTQVLAWYVVWPVTLAAPLGIRNKVTQVAVAYSVLYLPTFYAIHEDMLPTPVVPLVLLIVALAPPLAVVLADRAWLERLVPSHSGQVAA